MKLLIVLLFVFLVGVSGCLNISIFKDKAPAEEAAFVGGTQGLTAEFVELPQKIFQDTSMDIKLRVQNKGEAAIPEGSAQFTLNNAGAFQVDPAVQTNEVDFDKVRKFGSAVQGSIPTEIVWSSPGPRGLILTEEQSIPISVDLCYPYSTFTLTKACAARSSTSTICQPDAFLDVQNSGAPIQVTSLRNVAVPREGAIELALIMEIENLGEGDVYYDASLDSCNELSSTFLDKAFVKSISFGNLRVTEPECTPGTTLSFINDIAKTTCRITVDTTADIENDLVVELGYYYRERVSAAVSVIPL